MINLKIDDEYRDFVKEEPLRLVALTALAHQERPVDTEINRVITDNTVIKHLNKEYRGQDGPTDVLSFQSDIVDPERPNQLARLDKKEGGKGPAEGSR